MYTICCLAGIVRTRSLARPATARAYAAAQEVWATELRVKDKGKARCSCCSIG